MSSEDDPQASEHQLTPAEFERLATEADIAIAEARQSIAGGDTELVRRAAEKADLGVRNGSSLQQAARNQVIRPRLSRLQAVLGRLKAAAALLMGWRR